MGQKVNPTSLRLHPENKHFDSCWFSEKQYAHSIHKNLNVEAYYNGILKQIQYPSASFFLEAAPRKCKVSVLFLNPAQLREQAFRQFDSANRRNRKRKQSTLFSTKKETTPFYGLPKKGGGFLGLLPPSLLTGYFLQNLKNKNFFLDLVSAVFLDGVFLDKKTPSKKTIKKSVSSLENRKRDDKRDHNLVLSSFLQAKRSDLQISPSQRPLQEGALHALHGGMEMVDRQTNLHSNALVRGEAHTFGEARKSIWSSVLGLAISRYFVERKTNKNLLSATSRFLLLQAFFSSLKIQKRGDSSDGFSVKEPLLGNALAKPRQAKNSLLANPKVPLQENQKNARLYTPLLSSANPRLGKEVYKGDLHGGFAKGKDRQESGLFSNLKKSSIYAYHIESIISNKLKSSCRVSFFRAQNVAQSALFVAEEIVYQLQRRNTFRQIKSKFLQELGNKPAIKGVRVTCVGRIGGRAKKAQRARGESFKTGQTSLHLFNSKVSFASKTALTPFGAVGVKVWVCWK